MHDSMTPHLHTWCTWDHASLDTNMNLNLNLNLHLNYCQVRCFLGEDGNRWLMWYSGRPAGEPGLDAVAAAAGSIGAPGRQHSL